MPISFFLISSLQSPDLLVEFFIFLAFSKESDLGFDPEIKRVDHIRKCLDHFQSAESYGK